MSAIEAIEEIKELLEVLPLDGYEAAVFEVIGICERVLEDFEPPHEEIKALEGMAD